MGLGHATVYVHHKPHIAPLYDGQFSLILGNMCMSQRTFLVCPKDRTAVHREEFANATVWLITF
jgi:hypothetical protein